MDAAIYDGLWYGVELYLNLGCDLDRVEVGGGCGWNNLSYYYGKSDRLTWLFIAEVIYLNFRWFIFIYFYYYYYVL